MLLISLRQSICRFHVGSKVFWNGIGKRKLRLETRQLTCKMDDVQRVLRDLTLVSQQLEDEERRKLKRDALRAIDEKISISFLPAEDDFEVFHQNLKRTLGIEADAPFLKQKPMYTSPRDFIKIFQQNVTENTVQKLFENQHKIEWHTKTGDPDQFSFYGFCNDVVNVNVNANAGGETVMTYSTRRAHVNSKLYLAHEKLHQIRGQTFRQLCPPVHVRTKVGRRWTWKKWVCDPVHFEFVVEDGETDINWITNALLRDYITENSMQDSGGANFPNQEQHLYWAVLEENDFHHNQPHGETQIYVGKAARGIKDRWVGSQDSSHCRIMELSRNVMYNMMNYDPDVLARKLLVDLRFLLHMAYNQEGENSGLFIMQYPAGKLNQTEQQHIEGIKLSKTFTLEPKDMNYGMNG